MPRWLPWSLGFGGVVAALLFTTVLSPERVRVKVVAVDRGRVELTVTNTKAGTVRARRRAHLSPQVAGQVIDIARREGEWVERGQTIATLEDSSQRAQLTLGQESLRAVEASKREACIQRDRAYREVERKRELAGQNIVSEDVLDQLQSVYQAAAAACRRFDGPYVVTVQIERGAKSLMDLSGCHGVETPYVVAVDRVVSA